jgi:hypothetical protein
MINSTQNNPASTKNAKTHSVYVFCDHKSQENMKQYHESALFFLKILTQWDIYHQTILVDGMAVGR